MKKYSYLTFVLLFSACSVGPDFSLPEIELPKIWSNAPQEVKPIEAAEDKEKVNLSKWWLVFEDASLSGLVENSLSCNYDLEIAKSRVRQARASYKIAFGDFLPSISLSSGYQKSWRAGSNLNSPNISSSNSSQLFELGFDSAWEIDVFGGTRRSVEAAGADIEVAEENLRDVHVSLVAEVASNYFTLRSLQNNLGIAKENVENQKNTLSITQRRYGVGLENRQDVVSASAELSRELAQVYQLESAISQKIYIISALLGKQPTAIEADLRLSYQPIKENPDLPLELPSELLKRRPDIRRAEASLHAATARVGVAEANLFPRFSLSALINMQGDKISALGYLDNNIRSFNASLTQVLFQGGKLSANVELQKEKLDEQVLNYKRTVINALRDVEIALVNYQTEKKKLVELDNSVKSNQEALNLATKLYAEGLGEFLNVLVAKRNLLSSQDEFLQSKQNINLYLVSLYKALGGGWD